MEIKKAPMPLFQKVVYIASAIFMIAAFIYLGTKDYTAPIKDFNDQESFTKEFGITKQKLAKLLDVSGGTVGNRFRNPGEWKMCEVYAVCDLLNISPLDICEYFPREGRR